MDLDKAFRISSYLVIESGSSWSKPDEVMTTLYSRGAQNAPFSLADAKWHMSIKNGRSPALRIFFDCFSNVMVHGMSLLRRRFDSSRVMPGLLLESIWCKIEIGKENSASLMTFLDASRMYNLNFLYFHILFFSVSLHVLSLFFKFSFFPIYSLSFSSDTFSYLIELFKKISVD